MGNIERTLAIIKPDALDNFHDIVKMILDLGLVVDYCELRMLDDNIIREHYAHVLEQDFFPRLSEFMKSGPVAVMVFKGEDAVNKLRNLMGPTDSRLAPEGTIRAMYGTDKTINAIHGSDSLENAEIEIKRFVKAMVR